MSKKIYSSQFWGRVLSICLLVTIAACGVRELASGRLEPPAVALAGMRLFPPESNCWPLTALLQVTNPNPEPLRILGYDFTLAVQGAELVQGQSEAAVTIPAGDQTVVEVPLLLRLPVVPAALTALLKEEKITYQFAGGLRLASVLGGLRLPFRFQGSLTQAQGWEYLRQYLGPQPLTR